MPSGREDYSIWRLKWWLEIAGLSRRERPILLSGGARADW
jgi:hypothetical protein